MASKLEVLSLFGFKRDPFADHVMESADAKRVNTVLSMAVSARAQVAIVGDRGVGKSRSVAAALHTLKCQVVRVLSPDKGSVTAGDLQEAMIADLSDEIAKKAKEVRVRQLRRILGEASRKAPIVVVIDEAHRLKGWTLRTIKNLRELDWMGETQLFAVVLVGQSDPSQRSGLSEVRLRTETTYMHGLTRDEVTDYVRSTVGRVFSDGAVEAIADLKDTRNYLDLQDFLVRCMSNALAAGRNEVTPEDVKELMKTFVRDECLPHSRPKDAAKSGEAVRSVLERRKGKSLRAVDEQYA